ncbi:hypothetical protein VTN96DRAFT_1502 [Rasamsonia emersonii]
MPPTKQELSLLVHPLVPEAVQHNNRVLSQLRSLTAFLLGISAGILGLQSTAGFLYYLVGMAFVSALVQVFLIWRTPEGRVAGAGAFFPGSSGGEIEGIEQQQQQQQRWGWINAGEEKKTNNKKVIARKGAWRDVWLGGGVMGEALSGFVLGWAGVGGVLR